MARSGQESGVREIRLRRSMRRGLETGSSEHRASPRPYIEPWLLNEVTDVTIELKVALVGQIHSHGDWHGVDLSVTDRTRGIAVPYYLSVVAPSYAMDPRTRIEDCGVHVFEPGVGYHRLAAVEMSQRLRVMPGGRVPLIIVGAKSA